MMGLIVKDISIRCESRMTYLITDLHEMSEE